MPLDETTATIQYRATTDIAKERFNFPSEDFPDFQTTVNVPVLKLPVQTASGEVLGPDIVVTSEDGSLQMVAAVETVHTLNETSARQRWARFADFGVAFYLFAPAGYANQAKKLLKKAGVKGAKLRTWRYIAGLDWTLDLTDITREFSFNDLLPPFVTQFLTERRKKSEAKEAVKAEARAKEQALEAESAAAREAAREAARAEQEARRAAEPHYPHTTPPRP
jgi:hypothetical protein